MRTALIFRKRLLPYSETFIAAQGGLLPTYRPVFCGFSHEASGASMLAPHPTLTLDRTSAWATLTRAALRLGMTPRGQWMDAIRKEQPVLVHAHFGRDGIAAQPIAKALGVPLLVTFHGFDITIHQPGSTYVRQRAALFHHADRIIAVSDFIRDQLISKGCPSDRIIKHRIGIDLNLFQPDKQEAERPTILFVGRLTKKKGCHFLLEALSKLKHELPDLHLDLVGTGKRLSELQSLTDELGLSVTFHGQLNQDQIARLMHRAWIFCVPSNTAPSGDSEGLGMVFLEAQALETPVVSFAHGGVVEAVTHGETGLLAKEGSISELEVHLRTLLLDQTLRRKFGRAGLTRVREQFDVRRQCRELEAIYDGVLA